MISSIKSFSALSAVLLLPLTHSTTAFEVSQQQFDALHADYVNFHKEVSIYLKGANSSDPRIASLNRSLTTYDSQINKWAASTMMLGSESEIPEIDIEILTPGVIPAKHHSYHAPGSHSNNTSTAFSPHARNNLAVYYGQTPATANVSLGSVCTSPEPNIVILSFLITFFGPGGAPVVDFGPACGSAATPEAEKQNATGVLRCPNIERDVKTCQAMGKKVLLSLGGGGSMLNTTGVVSDDQAKEFAGTLWDVFGGGKGRKFGRPFREVVLDGFDVGESSSFVVFFARIIRCERKKVN